MQARGLVASLSGLKNQVRKVQPGFSEKAFGYGGFLQFAKAAATQDVITLEWDAEEGTTCWGPHQLSDAACQRRRSLSLNRCRRVHARMCASTRAACGRMFGALRPHEGGNVRRAWSIGSPVLFVSLPLRMHAPSVGRCNHHVR